MKPRTLVLRSAGTNCDLETAHAFELAGASADRVHINRLLKDPELLLREYQLLAIPGGFSYGDDIAAGKILANQIMHHLHDTLHRFVESGRPIIGICNGFQVLSKTDLLPGKLAGATGPCTTLTNNDYRRFVDRWTPLLQKPSRCIWTRDITGSEGRPTIELPVAHGEGKFVVANDDVRNALSELRLVALVYGDGMNGPAGGIFPNNPNGSIDDIAGICDSSGLVFGLMPHPERFVHPAQHPAWTRNPARQPEGLQIFRNAVDYVEQSLTVAL